MREETLKLVRQNQLFQDTKIDDIIKILEVVKSIAVLDKQTDIRVEHMQEAANYQKNKYNFS